MTPVAAHPHADSAATPADSEWAAAARQTLAQADAALNARFDAGEGIDRLLAARATLVDMQVGQAWALCLGEASDLALFAVGGYGRGELFPQSDIDLLVLAQTDAQMRHAEALARFFALLWDCGLKAGHAVRSPAQCVQAAQADIAIATALLEARLLRGEAGAIASLRETIQAAHVWPPAAFFAAKREELQQRHTRFGDTADNLEPNLKEGPGGLRDLHTLRWMALRVSNASELQRLIALGQLGEDEFASLDRQRQNLSRLRWGLHLVAGRAEERLRFDYQKALAERLGYSDQPGALAVEQMMQSFYRSAALVLRIGERLLQRFEEQLEGETAGEALNEQFELRRGYLAARDPHWPGASADAIFALFQTWAAHPRIRGLHSHTARALAEALACVPAYAYASAAQRDMFLQLLRGPDPVRTLERMARLGVLSRWLPAFANVSGRMQFDLFHVYTVDQHTLAVLRNLRQFATGQPDPRFAIAHSVWPHLRKPELLLLAALFHDIAKGRGGDHSELGAVDARQFCEAHGLSEAATDLVAWLVRQHLLMSTVAQKQDISDPDVIHRFALQVADRQRLDYLYLLTCADIAGTSPKLWNGWKDRLLADLYAATRLALRRGLEHPVAAAERIAETRALARELLLAHGVDAASADALFGRMPEESFLRGRPDQVAWQAMVMARAAQDSMHIGVRDLDTPGGQALEAFVQSPDRDGLFAAIVATLDRAGLAIQQARVLHGPGESIFDTFLLLPIDSRRPVIPADVERRLRDALSQRRLDQVRPTRRAQPAHLKHFKLPTQIEFAPAADPQRTLMSLVCTDRPGLLADVARALRSQNVRVHDARISTFGEKAEDMFQLTDERDAPLDQARQQALRQALHTYIDGVFSA